MSPKLSTIDEAVEAIAQGEIVIVMDAEDRENEGDFVCAAEKTTDEMVNFIDEGLTLLQKEYLGGSGTRGYGKVTIPKKTFKMTTDVL